MVLDEYASLWPLWYGVGRQNTKCGSRVTSWMSRFLEKIENSFVAEGIWVDHGTLKRWSVSFMEKFANQSARFVLRKMDLVGWLNVNIDHGICDAIVLFNTSLCEPLQLAGLCPAVCGLCGVRGVRNTSKTWFRHRGPCCSLVFSQCSSQMGS